jgi:hypothetical protein
MAWTEPLPVLAKRYRLSEYNLRKICIDLSIPLPRAGHWKKAQTGERLSIPPLPDSPAKAKVKLPAPFVEQKTVSVHRSPLDPLLVAVKATLTDKDRHTYDGLRRNKSGQLEIRVAPKNVDRAIHFMNNFLQALRGRGHSIEITSEGTFAVVHEQRMSVCCREKLKRVTTQTLPYSRTELQPTGTLSLSCNDREWKEGSETLEEKIPAILDKMEEQSKRQAEEERKWAAWRADYAESERLRKELEQKRQSELAGFMALITQASRWRQTMDIRGYLDAFEQYASAGDTLTDERRTWLAWARAKVGWYDPFQELPDEWLVDVDRDTLKEKNTYGTS